MGCGTSSTASDGSEPVNQKTAAALTTRSKELVGDISELLTALSHHGDDASHVVSSMNEKIKVWMDALSEAGQMAWTDPGFFLEAIKVLRKISEALQEKLLRGEDQWLQSDFGFELVSQTSQILAMIATAEESSPRNHVKRVAGGHGWALHGLAFELQDGTRLGKFLTNSGSEMDLLGDSGLRDRGSGWKDLQAGERILQVSGYHCKQGYLAYGISLHTNLGRVITYTSSHQDWKGKPFNYKAPAGQEIEKVNFGYGKCTGIRCVPFLFWDSNTELAAEIRKGLDAIKEPVVTLLANVSKSKGAGAQRYALGFAQSMNLGGLECLDGFRENVSDSFNLPGFWDLSIMEGLDVVADSGLNFDPSFNKNWWGKCNLDAEELATIQLLIDASFRKRYTRDRKGSKVPDGLKLLRAVRIQNALNWADYIACKSRIKKELANLRNTSDVLDSLADLKTALPLPVDNGQKFHELNSKYEVDMDANSVWLFHGTNEAAADSISRGDFRVDKAGSNAGTLFGRGVYLAESCSKSDEYSEENAEGLRCLMLCRAVLGNINYCAEKRPNVNELVTSCTAGSYHSVLGDREKIHHTFREFIVYDGNQVYPEFVLWYRRMYN